MPEPHKIPEVYISYAGNDAGDVYEKSRDYIVKNICTSLEQKGLHAREYKRDIQYKDSIEQFMDDIAAADYIVLLISKKYLESEYCMYEATELLSKNKKGLKDKIFPVVLDDARIFDTDNHLEYVMYWIDKYNTLNEKIKGIDPQKIISLHNKAIVYREISENTDALLRELTRMKQLDDRLINANDYSLITDGILRQIAKKQPATLSLPADLSGQSSLSVAGFASPASVVNMQTDIAAMSKGLNNVISNLINQFDAQVQDSEKAKKEYINVKFDEISGEGKLSPLTRDFVLQIRTQKDRFEPYRRSLIISALSLGLIKKYDEEKARLLLDFIADGEPELSHRAVAGLITGLLDKADYISDEIQLKLKKLRNDDDVQDCLIIIFSLLGNLEELHKVSESLKDIDFGKFEFFNQAQHWFLPFYSGNPVLKENVANKKLAKELVNTIVFAGLDSTKYAIALLFPEIQDEQVKNLENLIATEKSFLNILQSQEFRDRLVKQLGVSKYILEFYVYAVFSKNDYMVNLIEDKKQLRRGPVCTLTMHPHAVCMRKAGEHLLKKEFLEAVHALQPLLEDEPNNKQALYVTGSSYFWAGKFSEAILYFEKARSKGVQEPALLAELGDAYFNINSFDSAAQVYDELLAFQENTGALISLGRCHTLKSNPDYAKALTYHLRLYQIEPANFLNLVFSGDCYYNLTPNDNQNAFIYYYKAFEINPDHLALVKMLDQTASALEYKEASIEQREKIYSKYIALEPGNIKPYVFMGLTLENKTPPEYDLALSYYKQAFGIDNSNAFILVCMGNVLQKIHPPDYTSSLQYLHQALTIEPGNHEALMHAGWAYFVTGVIEKAKPYFEKCTDSGFAHAAFQNLAHIALLQHDETTAKQLYKKGYALFTNKDDFFTTSTEDYQYLQPAGIDKEHFMSLLREAGKQDT